MPVKSGDSYTESDRLKYIRHLVEERGIEEIHTMEEAMSCGLVKVGQMCYIQQGVILGLDGFGYERNEQGEWEKFPHYGRVIIGDKVDIYAGTYVQRGTLDDTLIGSGTKIAQNCQIGHSSQIGRNCMINPFVTISGGVQIGNGAIIGQFCYVSHNITIGEGAIVGDYSKVTKDVDPHTKVRGIPAEIVT